MNFLDVLDQVRDSSRDAKFRDREKGSGNRTAPVVEPLETICLLSTTPLQTITEPTISLASSFTNFGPPSTQPPLALSPSLPLFNPALGTLVSVQITGTASISSQIGSENISTSSGTTITAHTGGSIEVDGLGAAPISDTLSAETGTPGQEANFVATKYDGTTDFAGTSGHTFAPLTATDNVSETLTDPADLAFFTATTAQPTTTATMSANAQSGATAVGGNLATEVTTTALSQLTVTYQYTPAPLPPPSVVSLVRYGVHREQTQLILTFSGAVDPIAAQDTTNYVLAARGANGQFGTAPNQFIPISTAVYNPDTLTVTLIPSRNLNVHAKYRYQLTVASSVFGASSTGDYSTVFGGPSSLGGFIYHHSGRFFSVVNGRVQPLQTTPPPGFLNV